ncbi:ATP-binding cassette domain-containing protein [Streptomyces sp. AJS327]|uniref:ATP-binding cassette domain-containing protein n=1 Tax=Streptomyces sp. AJS327 TaxID=2545265 RepID=UPI0015DD9820|nr:ATP-binding cassette domain-containing protein [Streptomyces sp. AJS327]
MTLHGVGRRYGPRGPWVLKGIDLELPRPALLRVEGGNGSGKSTLLRLLAGIDAPSTGRITGRPPSAFVPERFPAALPFTALGYLVHLARLHGLRGRTARRAAREWLERFGAGEFASTPLAELSKGTSQKVAVAQALLGGPGLLVLDEAWTGLDQPARELLDRAVAERVADGGTVVFVDHDPRRLAGVQDTAYRVGDGTVWAVPGSGARAPEAPGGARAEDGPSVRVEAEGPPGARPPLGPPGARVREQRADGTVTLTVPAPASDALLRALLTASPPWHVRSATPAEAPPPPSASGSAPAPPASRDQHPGPTRGIGPPETAEPPDAPGAPRPPEPPSPPGPPGVTRSAEREADPPEPEAPGSVRHEGPAGPAERRGHERGDRDEQG